MYTLRKSIKNIGRVNLFERVYLMSILRVYKTSGEYTYLNEYTKGVY